MNTLEKIIDIGVILLLTALLILILHTAFAPLSNEQIIEHAWNAQNNETQGYELDISEKCLFLDMATNAKLAQACRDL